ncbi:MAG: DUF805 domain-containing protein, partial [Mogibacterium sp.]|nr:DUF805 domain-containing protein [Mogibacterium sp.]
MEYKMPEDEEDAVIQNYIDMITKNYANFEGRATRYQYWTFTLITFVISFVLALPGIPILPGIFSAAIFLPGLGLCIRRLHDIGKSGFWYLLILTGIGAIVILVFFCMDSQPGENQYGPNPKGVSGSAGGAGGSGFGTPAGAAAQGAGSAVRNAGSAVQ